MKDECHRPEVGNGGVGDPDGVLLCELEVVDSDQGRERLREQVVGQVAVERCPVIGGPEEER